MNRLGAPQSDAWHEAGHGVVAHVLGGRVRTLSLEVDEDDLEGTAAIEWPSPDARTTLAASACTALGGPLAELAFQSPAGPLEFSVLSAWAADWREVERCAARLAPAGTEREQLIRGWIRTTRALFDDPEVVERVARVADALDAHGTLDDTLFLDALAADC